MVEVQPSSSQQGVYAKQVTQRARRPTHDRHGRPIPRRTKPKMKEKNQKKKFSEIAVAGPLKKRNCTDCVCCILFYIFVVFHIVTFGYAFYEGNPWLLSRPFDVDSNPCGANTTETSDYPMAYFISPMDSYEKVICIKKCPSWKTGETVPTSLGGCYIGGQNATALTGIDNSQTKRQQCSNVAPIDLNESKAFILAYLQSQYSGNPIINMYNSTSLLGSFCVPSSDKANAQFREHYQDFVGSTANSDIAEEYLSDLYSTWMIIMASAFFAFFISLVYMFFLYCCVGVIIWMSIILFFLILIAFAVLLHFKAEQYSDLYDESKNPNYQTSHRKFFYSALVLDLIIFIFFCATCCYMRTIELTIAVLKSAALFVAQNFFIVFVPVITSIVMLFYFTIWCGGILFLWSIGTYIKREGYPIGKVQWTNQHRGLVYSFMFGVLWIGCFMLYYGQFIIIAATTIWYFDHNEKKTTHPFPILSALWWTFRYHTGSIAFGAFILAVVIAMKLIVKYVQWQVERLVSKQQQSWLIRGFFAMLNAILTCTHRIIKVINKSGFICVALKSQYFCLSCLEGMTLILRNPIKFGMISIFGEIFVFVGKLFVASITSFVGYMVITQFSPYTETLNTPYLPTMVFFFNGLVVGSIFMSIYGLSADTIMFCFFVEKDIGGILEGKNCPPPMKAFFEKYKTDTPSSEDEK